MAASERNKDVYKIFKHSAVKIIKVEKGRYSINKRFGLKLILKELELSLKWLHFYLDIFSIIVMLIFETI